MSGLKLTGRAVDQLPLLHALADTPGVPMTEIGERLGRDKSNLHKTLTALAEHGIVDPENKTTLTDEGKAIVALIAVDGGVRAEPADTVVTWAEIDPDPDNERKFDQDDETQATELDALRESILERGLLQPILLTAEPDGRFMVVAGERRWRAIGEAIHEADLPADWPIPHRLLPPMDALARAQARMAENLQRTDLHWTEEAAGYTLLRERHGQSDDEIADAAKRSKKHVQDYLRVLATASPDDLRRARLPKEHDEHVGYRRLRDQLQAQNAKPVPKWTPTYPIDALALLELAHRCKARPSKHVAYPGSKGWTEIGGRDLSADVFDAQALVDAGLLNIEHPDWATSSFARLTDWPDLTYWLIERGYPDGLDGAVYAARATIVGELEAARLRGTDEYATEWLNAQPTPRPLSTEQTLNTPRSEILAPADHPRDTPARDPIDVSAAGPPVPPPETLEPAGMAVASAPAPDLPQLSPLAAAAMLDVAHAIATGGVEGPQGAYVGAACWNYFNDAGASQLLHARLVKFQPDANRRGYLVCLTEAGAAWVEALPDDLAMPVPPYATAWLNKPEPASSAAPPSHASEAGRLLGDDFSRQMREVATGGDPQTPEPDLSLAAQIAYCESWLASGMASLGGEPDDTQMFEAILASLQRLQAAEAADA